MDLIYNLMLTVFMGLIAIVAGMFEDLESDVASTSNPNSQVQLAPQIGNLHKLFNRAVSGEPLLVGTMATIAGVICYVLLSLNYPLVLVLLIATFIATLVQVVLSITSYMGRITSQALYNQPLFLDVIYKHVPIMAAHAYISIFSITLLSYIMTNLLNPVIPVALPVMSLLLGLSLGSIGSAVGDIHYGAEKLYQSSEFGCGIPVSLNGNITTKSALGSRQSIDVVNFCSKFGGPVTGLCFGIIIFLNFWIYLVFGIQGGLLAGVCIIIIFLVLNIILERKSRLKYGKFEK
ncbi:tetrahydromethanopterin S-methyltransferase subunit E [Methanosphaera sp. ISO3-F5]|uniref:tetrahydromethanopterin S-methyltransferase subunit E n=1 Tax=Methanosphaera sp. ISO3-F5 TaxID=1452353 RepID=UPI002B258869|nr:tetrahydromethanopterin S-methyltransferase subunit E [Methanosphaera sp. ISO3-F5]WQH65189.1 tetrahydromethanopterin S-methyltransferase subunit E [Methanosphaera sp. ISO3-F5]